MPRNTLRPRKPRTGSVELTPLLPGRGRPEPPRGLSTRECRIWNDVVDSLPDGWLDLSAQLILRRLVMQCAIVERREERLRRLLEDPSSNASEDIDALAPAHAETAKHIAYMLTQLRATPRSRMPSRAAGVDFTSNTSERPWEVRARTRLS
jgi:hypothetical protein